MVTAGGRRVGTEWGEEEQEEEEDGEEHKNEEQRREIIGKHGRKWSWDNGCQIITPPVWPAVT